MKYLYLQPMGGLNDILCRINYCINYCKNTNRILLLDTYNSFYKINFSEYIDISNIIEKSKYIDDINTIKSLDFDNSTTFYPSCITLKHFKEILDGKIISKYVNGLRNVDINNNSYVLPHRDVEQSIIVHIQCGGGSGFHIFKDIMIKPTLKEYCKLKYLEMPKKYISVQVRNTDIKCNYKVLFNMNKNIFKNNTVYLATDSLEVLNYFRENGINVINFCHFPNYEYNSLHTSDIDPQTKLFDMFTDIVILSMGMDLISSSGGRFIRLLRDCYDKKDYIKKMFDL